MIKEIHYDKLKNMVDGCFANTMFGITINKGLFFKLFDNEVRDMGITSLAYDVSLNREKNCITVSDVKI